MQVTNKHNLPEPIVAALTKSDYSRGASNRSVTQLIDSPRVRILRAEHADEITEDASDMVWSVLGTAVHKMFEEGEQEGYEKEERLFVEVNNWVISGAVDLQRSDGDSVEILDYKCTSVWSVIYGKVEWENQLNFYAWLVEKSKEVNVSGLKIIAVLRDWQRKKAETDKSYPQAPIVEVDVPLWDKATRDDYVTQRVEEHSHAEFERLTGGDLPECTPSERWEKETTYAVKKKGNKRATKVFDNETDAMDMIATDDKLEVEVRPGASTRCEGDYCRVARFCDQWRAMQDVE
jgi:hypothetical protein